MEEEGKTPITAVKVAVMSIVALIVLIFINTRGSSPGLSEPVKVTFPPQAQNVLHCSWSSSDNQWGFSKPISDQILESTGNSEYIGSSTYPMTITVSNADHGASFVSVKINKGSGGTLADMAMRTDKIVEFDYWIAEDGQHIKPTNDNAQEIWTLYSNG